MAVLLIGYDVERDTPGSDTTSEFISKALETHSHYSAPCTLFVTGKAFENAAGSLKLAASHSELFDIHSHMYSHMLLKTVCAQHDGKTEIWRGGSLEEIKEDAARGLAVLRDNLGVPVDGLCGPYNYYRGLSDRPDILEVLHPMGVRFLRCAGRNEHDWQPVDLHVQPFWYTTQGFPDMLEFPIHGWQDCIWRQNRGWDKIEEFTNYQLSLIDKAADRDCVLSLAYHDWSSIKEDPEMSIINAILARARSSDMTIMSYRDYYLEQMKLKEQADVIPSPGCYPLYGSCFRPFK